MGRPIPLHREKKDKKWRGCDCRCVVTARQEEVRQEPIKTTAKRFGALPIYSLYGSHILSYSSSLPYFLLNISVMRFYVFYVSYNFLTLFY
jgi:hypothetical protein